MCCHLLAGNATSSAVLPQWQRTVTMRWRLGYSCTQLGVQEDSAQPAVSAAWQIADGLRPAVSLVLLLVASTCSRVLIRVPAARQVVRGSSEKIRPLRRLVARAGTPRRPRAPAHPRALRLDPDGDAVASVESARCAGPRRRRALRRGGCGAAGERGGARGGERSICSGITRAAARLQFFPQALGETLTAETFRAVLLLVAEPSRLDTAGVVRDASVTA
jgi:hypothetical protein